MLRLLWARNLPAALTQNRDKVTIRLNVADLELPPDRSRIAAEASAVRAVLRSLSMGSENEHAGG
jgi:hypothetical protein